jgi:hypothetical protein
MMAESAVLTRRRSNGLQRYAGGDAYLLYIGIKWTVRCLMLCT